MSKDDEVCSPGGESNSKAVVQRSSQKNATYDSFYDEQVYIDSGSVEEDDDTTEESFNEKAPSTRLDITASLLSVFSEQEKQQFIDTFVKEYSNKLTTIHLSGQGLRRILTTEQIKALVQSIGKVHSITEFFCFHGGCKVLTSELLAKFLPPNLKVLMLWHFPSVSKNFAAALRQQSSLTRVTLNFSCSREEQMEWGCLDVCAMAFASMAQLQVLQIRCIPKTTHEQIKTLQQQESIISPEAIVLLLNSSSITQLYLENCGLIDDHMDEVYNELPKNKTLVALDVKGNMFSDDCLYTTGRLLPIAPPQFQSLDISGVPITDAAGKAVARGMTQNNTLQSLEIEGTLLRFHDEFDIPPGHTNTKWMQDINHQLRLNRAYHMATEDQSTVTSFASKQNAVSADVTAFVTAVSSVSDNASCLFHFLRTYSHHCDRLTAPTPHMEPR